MANIKAIRNHIVFQFEDSIVRKSSFGKERKQFGEKTDWGFEMSDYDDGTKAPRWGIVVSIGHEVTSDVQIGDKILIDALKWTESVQLNGESYWRTDDSCVLAIDEDYHH